VRSPQLNPDDLARALGVEDPRLRPSEDLACARRTLESFDARDEQQADFKRRMLELIARHPTGAHRRTTLEGHLTASALIVDEDVSRALLTHHRKLGKWLQLGGHCDGDANLAHVALRECLEESGIEELRICPTPIDLDIHTIPARPGEPEHLHYDARFVVVAPRGAHFAVSEESHALEWIAPADLGRYTTDDSVRRLYEQVFGPKFGPKFRRS
jgi:8-oxo-dGTP pyrophosphatase MutT (NUDIX family)